MDKPTISVNYGLASSYDDCIEVNYKLPTELKNRILNHERKHSSGNYNIQDFKNDFQSDSSYFFESFKFALVNPEALVGFFPFMWSYYKKILTYNSSAVYPFLWFGLLFSIFSLVVLKASFFIAFLDYTIVVAWFNFALIALTNILVRKNKGFIYKAEDMKVC